MTARGAVARAGLVAIAAANPRQVPLAEVADVQVVEGPATIKSENGLLRNYVRVNVRGPRRRRPGRRGQAGRRQRGQAPGRRLPRVDRPVRARARARRTLDAGRADRGRADLPDPLPDLSRPGRRGADDAGGARGDRRRAFLPVAAGPEAVGDGLGRLHRLLRHGDLDRHHHAGLPARGGREGRRARAHRPRASCAWPC